MFCVKLDQTINQIIFIFYRLGLWHRGEEPTAREKTLQIFYLVYYALFPVSLIAGSIKNDNKDKSIFLVVAAILTSVVVLKLFYIIWKKKQIIELLNQICVYYINDLEKFTLVDDKLKRFSKSVVFLLIPTYICATCGAVVAPFLGRRKTLFLNIGFPLDWKKNQIAYWTAFTFLSTEIFLTSITALFSVIIWYLVMNCALKYEVLENLIRKMGNIKVIGTTGRPIKMSKLEKVNTFLGHFIEATKFNHRIREEIKQMESFLSLLFFMQVATSGLCICGSIYSIILSISENLMEYMIHLGVLFYNLFEIFMVMYFGNEIKLSSDRLTYCLFESDWIDQPQSSKKLLIIFGEILKQPNGLVVGKLYSLTLDTFIRILRSAYSMFNVLKNIK